MSTKASKEQIIAVNAILAKSGQMDNKPNIIANATNGRTTHSSALTFQEAKALIAALTNAKPYGKTLRKPSKKMVGKLVAMAHEIGWIKQNVNVGKNGLQNKKDYSILHDWIEKYGYLHKPLDQYSYNEFPKLVAQLEMGAYKHYLSKL